MEIAFCAHVCCAQIKEQQAALMQQMADAEEQLRSAAPIQVSTQGVCCGCLWVPAIRKHRRIYRECTRGWLVGRTREGCRRGLYGLTPVSAWAAGRPFWSCIAEMQGT